MMNDSTNLTNLPVVLTTTEINNDTSSMNVSSTNYVWTTTETNNVSFTNVSLTDIWKYTTETISVSSIIDVSSTDVWSNTTSKTVRVDGGALYFVIIGASLLVACVVGCIVFIFHRSGLCDGIEERKNMKRKQRRMEARASHDQQFRATPDRGETRVNFTETTNSTCASDGSTAPQELVVMGDRATNQERMDIARQDSVPSSRGSDHSELIHSDSEDKDSVFYSYQNPNYIDSESVDVHL